MSHVSKVMGIDQYKYSECFKLLDKPGDWELNDFGTPLEKFTHASGIYFYTGCSFVTFRKTGGVEIICNPFRFIWNTVIQKEKRFIKAWYKVQEDK